MKHVCRLNWLQTVEKSWKWPKHDIFQMILFYLTSIKYCFYIEINIRILFDDDKVKAFGTMSFKFWFYIYDAIQSSDLKI